MTHICVSKLTIIGSDNGLSPGRRQAIIWITDGILFIGPLGTKFSEIVFEIVKIWFMKIHLKMSPGTWRTFCLGLNVLNVWSTKSVSNIHDGVMIWKTFLYYWSLVRGTTGQRLITIKKTAIRNFNVSFVASRTSCRTNIRFAGGLIRHDTDVTPL